MTAVPPGLIAAIQGYLARSDAGSLVESTRSMSQRYRQCGGSDDALDFRAYLVARLPATYATVAFCLAELARRVPQFTPASLLDVGSGPGTAAWAAAVAYAELSSFTFLDNNAQFLKLACSLAAQSDHPALQRAKALNDNISSLQGVAADFVVVAYALAELPQAKAEEAASVLRRACKNTLLIIEPGTPQGFARIHRARATVTGRHTSGFASWNGAIFSNSFAY
jgi:ribosomal protein RSM22 (predicted rRNA methylase)